MSKYSILSLVLVPHKKWNKLVALRQISQIAGASVSNEGLGVKIFGGSIHLPSAFRQIPSLFRQISSPPSYSEPVPEMEDFFWDGKRSVWNGWEVKFYVNSCVKMSSSHVRRVTCGIFPCEPNLDWRLTIWKVKSFQTFLGIFLKIQGLKCVSDDEIGLPPRFNSFLEIMNLDVGVGGQITYPGWPNGFTTSWNH